MKILICYFSGTGNTKKLVNCYAETFTNKYNDEVTLQRIEDEYEVDFNEYDLIGIGFPVYAFNSPAIVLKFCKQLPKLANKTNGFIVNTSGEPLKLNNIATLKVKSVLKRKNIIVNNEYRYCMPYNMIFRHGDEMAYRMWQTAQLLAPLDVAEIEQGTKHLHKRVFMGRFVSWAFRCQHWGSKINGKMYKADEHCLKCNKCVNICPTRNIKVKDGKIKFGGKCIMCMRCAHYCPTNAVKAGMFNGWKVNGAYTFAKPDKPDTVKYNRMLTRSYAKYFDNATKRITDNYPAETVQEYTQTVQDTTEETKSAN
ncbi:MAG: EFR1 family ferrodoxin [Clostridia bacterium]|nr:EFR1 family ferrodoxin [Clostridia bacterium]